MPHLSFILFSSVILQHFLLLHPHATDIILGELSAIGIKSRGGHRSQLIHLDIRKLSLLPLPTAAVVSKHIVVLLMLSLILLMNTCCSLLVSVFWLYFFFLTKQPTDCN